MGAGFQTETRKIDMKRIHFGPIDFFGCADALQRLDPYLDRELSASESAKLRFHLRICRQCAQRFAFEADFNTALREKLGHLEVSPEWKAKIARSIEKSDS